MPGTDSALDSFLKNEQITHLPAALGETKGAEAQCAWPWKYFLDYVASGKGVGEEKVGSV